MRILILILICAVCWHGTFAEAGGLLDRSSSGEGVTISIASPFSDFPPGGCVPYTVTIENNHDSSGTWRIWFKAQATNGSVGASYFAQDLTVAANATGVFDLAVPLPFVPESGNTTLTAGVRGPGFRDSGSSMPMFGYIYSRNSGSNLPFCVIGSEVLGASGTGPLETLYKGSSESYYGSAVEAPHLPSDWRALSGVARVILSDTEWLSLNSAQRGALTDYIAQGGRLVLLTTQNVDTRTPELQLPTPDAKAGAYGFGQIVVQSVAAFPPDVSVLQNLIEHDGADSARAVDLDFSTWNLRDRVGSFTVHTGFIIVFVALFGAMIGPVNLFYFAGGSKRFWLFWTTPVISLLASAALLLGILVTDGLGGQGKQLIAFFSLPGVNREVVVQEQIARAAVLFSSRWHTDQDYLISPISEHSLENAAAPAGYRTYNSGSDYASEKDSFAQVGNEYSGNWFRSRTVSGQYVQAMRPSRSSVTVLNAAAVNLGQEPPTILSSFSGTLSHVYLIDNQGHVWACTDLAPGQKEACVASSLEAYRAFWTDACGGAGGKLRGLLSSALDRPGCFYAVGAPNADESLSTSGEIRWEAVQGLYLGPWVASTTTTGNGP